MNAEELREIISLGETSTVQFKEKMPHKDSIAQELVAMSNSLGGVIFIGVKDVSGDMIGLSSEEFEYSERIISQEADNIKPPVYITTESVQTENNRIVLVVRVPEGINKPYKTAKSEMFVKQGSNKRLLTDNSEILRLFQKSGKLFADEMEVFETSIDDIDKRAFDEYFTKEFSGQTYEEKGLTFEEALRVKRVLRNGRLTLAGLLFFGKEPQSFKSACTIKAVSFFGNDIAGLEYRNKPSDFRGTIPEVFEKAMNFLTSSLQHVQAGQQFNSVGKLEVSEIALIELVQNALVHRDYFKNSPIRLLIFDNRIEIISPGALPNSLTVEEIKFGNPVIRNNQIVSFATRLLPFSGLGSGIKRALTHQPDIQFVNDIQGEQFTVILPRPLFT